MFGFHDPVGLLLSAPLILLSLTIHEYAHARVAEACGDPTARLAGRVSLNPLVHLDPIGTLMLLFGPVGWARPVPVNPAYLRQLRRDTLLVAAAGPASNFALAFVLGALFRAAPADAGGGMLSGMLLRGVFVNLGLSFFNLIPVPPLDGSRVLASLLPDNLADSYLRFEPYAPLVLMLLIVPGFFTSFSPVWTAIGPFVVFFLRAFTGAGVS